MAELRRAQQRRRNMKRGGVVGIAVVIALVLALYSGGAFGHSKKKVVATTGSTTTTSVAPTTSPTTVPASATPLPLTTVEAALVARTPPAKSASCHSPSGHASGAVVAAKAPAVAVINAPKGAGFPALDGSAPHYTKFAAAPPFCIDATGTYTATMKTTAGTVTIELLPRYAPVTVNNFVFLAGYHFFDGTIFHRVIPGFVDQGGDPTGTGLGGPGYKFADELPRTIAAYDSGAFAMANSGANTNGSQFFLIDGSGGSGLTDAYTMYGQVTSGLDVVAKINAGGTSGGTPKTLYKITSVTVRVRAPGASSPTSSS